MRPIDKNFSAIANTRECDDRSLWPANLDAERAILGAIMLDNAAYSAGLDTADFSLESHRSIHLRISEMIGANLSVDLITLIEELNKHNELEAVGDRAYLFSLTEGLPRRIALDQYIAIVQEKSKLRRIIEGCQMAIAACAELSKSADEIVKELGVALKGIRGKVGK